jgi:putative oxidoreductase
VTSGIPTIDRNEGATMQTQRHDACTSFGLLILRVGIGGLMILHGWGKLQMLLANKAAEFPDPLGIGNQMSLGLAVAGEFVGAALVVLGLATRLAALLPIGAMAVAIFVVHANDPLTMEEGAKLFQTGAAKSWSSKEPALLYLIPFLALVFTGAGAFSLDRILFGRRRATSEKPY